MSDVKLSETENGAPAKERKSFVDDRQKTNGATQAEMMAFMNEPTMIHRDKRSKVKTPPRSTSK